MKCLLYMYEWRCTIHYCIPIIVISVSYAAAIAVYYYAFFADGDARQWHSLNAAENDGNNNKKY